MSDNSPNRNDVEAYYDQFSTKLIRDYINGNERLRVAIDRVLTWVDPSVKTVLDLGCGIGTSSSAVKAGSPWIQIDGVDLSSTNVRIATSLFAAVGIAFRAAELRELPAEVRYDMVMMIDVYEHIPHSQRRNFSEALSERLASDGRVVLTMPSPLHQQHLTQHNPSGLQIIDETVTFQDVARLALDLRAEVMLYEMVSVWNSNDYVHVVLQRSPSYRRLTRTMSLLKKILARYWHSEKREVSKRKAWVQNKLGIVVE